MHQLTIVTEQTYIVNSLVSLSHEPKNLDGLCPILNNSTMLSYLPVVESDQVSVASLAVGPEGKGVRIETDDGRIGEFKGTRGLIQYVADLGDSEFQFVPVTETNIIEGNKLYTSEELGMLNGQSPILNNGTGVLLLDGSAIANVKLVVTGKNELTLALPDTTIEELSGTDIVYQYTTLVPKRDSFCYVVTEELPVKEGLIYPTQPMHQGWSTPLFGFGLSLELKDESGSYSNVFFNDPFIIDFDNNMIDIYAEGINGTVLLQYWATKSADETKTD